MNFTSIYRVVKFAGQSFWRNIWLSLVTITIITLAFISINSLLVINAVTNEATQIVKDKVDISLYFKPTVSESQVLEVQNYLSSLAEVKEINYVSQKDALENFRQRHIQDPIIIQSLEELNSNPIGATLQIKAKSIDDYQSIITVVNNSKYNDLIMDKNFDDHKLYIDKIKNFSDSVKTIGLVTTGIFIIIALLIVFNTIRVAIYTHREEITIMKLVGATNWFIRSPFLLEAALYGIISCILAIGIVYPMLNIIQPYLNSFFLSQQFNLINYFNQNFLKIFGLELLAIICLNIISSSIAIRRYLKV